MNRWAVLALFGSGACLPDPQAWRIGNASYDLAFFIRVSGGSESVDRVVVEDGFVSGAGGSFAFDPATSDRSFVLGLTRADVEGLSPLVASESIGESRLVRPNETCGRKRDGQFLATALPPGTEVTEVGSSTSMDPAAFFASEPRFQSRSLRIKISDERCAAGVPSMEFFGGRPFLTEGMTVGDRVVDFTSQEGSALHALADLFQIDLDRVLALTPGVLYLVERGKAFRNDLSSRFILLHPLDGKSMAVERNSGGQFRIVIAAGHYGTQDTRSSLVELALGPGGFAPEHRILWTDDKQIREVGISQGELLAAGPTGWVLTQTSSTARVQELGNLDDKFVRLRVTEDPGKTFILGGDGAVWTKARGSMELEKYRVGGNIVTARGLRAVGSVMTEAGLEIWVKPNDTGFWVLGPEDGAFREVFRPELTSSNLQCGSSADLTCGEFVPNLSRRLEVFGVGNQRWFAWGTNGCNGMILVRTTDNCGSVLPMPIPWSSDPGTEADAMLLSPTHALIGTNKGRLFEVPREALLGR